jgi:uncharacterized repeat protein (TIGR03803 family)
VPPATKWKEKVLYHFLGGNDGNGPESELMIGTDGTFHGTTYDGGASAQGTVFSVAPGP